MKRAKEANTTNWRADTAPGAVAEYLLATDQVIEFTKMDGKKYKLAVTELEGKK